MTFYIPYPTNHNDNEHTTQSLQEAIIKAKDSYGDIYVKIYVVKNNKIVDIEKQIDNFIGALK